ncbi:MULTISPECIES: MarR family winged helix-turn-helix transcriptional regulator [unclassified Frankia]|uniref:MarR family winged helix-turn-helix transcriptional regulator n=1 Tax=unclassified Frankia TaxID=2632575 RepID=UPI002AD5A6BE|nr:MULTISPECIES: MarR family transcriptional regulator [unclassified Frankia]
MAKHAGEAEHSALCLRLMQLMPRIARGMRRSQDRAAPATQSPLSPRHVAVLEQLRDEPLTVGTLAARLELTLSTVSGVLADLDRAGFVIREADAGDRRRTIVKISPQKVGLVDEWLDDAAEPLLRVLNQLDASERAAFLKAMDLLEAELRVQDSAR